MALSVARWLFVLGLVCPVSVLAQVDTGFCPQREYTCPNNTDETNMNNAAASLADWEAVPPQMKTCYINGGPASEQRPATRRTRVFYEANGTTVRFQRSVLNPCDYHDGIAEGGSYHPWSNNSTVFLGSVCTWSDDECDDDDDHKCASGVSSPFGTFADVSGGTYCQGNPNEPGCTLQITDELVPITLSTTGAVVLNETLSRGTGLMDGTPCVGQAASSTPSGPYNLNTIGQDDEGWVSIDLPWESGPLHFGPFGATPGCIDHNGYSICVDPHAPPPSPPYESAPFLGYNIAGPAPGGGGAQGGVSGSVYRPSGGGSGATPNPGGGGGPGTTNPGGGSGDEGWKGPGGGQASNNCNREPTCSDPASMFCAILKQDWFSMCNANVGTMADLERLTGMKPSDLPGAIPVVNGLPNGMLNPPRWATGSDCQPITFTVFGEMRSINIHCQFLGWLAPLVLVAASIAAFRIVAS
jgi:hypothetical protein